VLKILVVSDAACHSTLFFEKKSVYTLETHRRTGHSGVAGCSRGVPRREMMPHYAPQRDGQKVAKSMWDPLPLSRVVYTISLGSSVCFACVPASSSRLR
jgi:hypothetical protein